MLIGDNIEVQLIQNEQCFVPLGDSTVLCINEENAQTANLQFENKRAAETMKSVRVSFQFLIQGKLFPEVEDQYCLRKRELLLHGNNYDRTICLGYACGHYIYVRAYIRETTDDNGEPGLCCVMLAIIPSLTTPMNYKQKHLKKQKEKQEASNTATQTEPLEE